MRIHSSIFVGPPEKKWSSKKELEVDFYFNDRVDMLKVKRKTPIQKGEKVIIFLII